MKVSCIDRGNLANDSDVLNSLSQHLDGLDGNYCLDGFPRRLTQAQEFDRKRPDDLKAVLLLQIPDCVLIERISGIHYFTLVFVFIYSFLFFLFILFRSLDPFTKRQNLQ